MYNQGGIVMSYQEPPMSLGQTDEEKEAEDRKREELEANTV
jgi:hypothetical protein